MKRLVLVQLVALTILALPLEAGAQSDPATDLDLGKNAFYYQDYDRAIALLRPLLEPNLRLTDPADIQLAREMLGAALWWKRDRSGFEDQFTLLLEQNPAFELDSFYYPPDMVQDFHNKKEQLIAQGMIKRVDESSLTGECRPVEKVVRRVPLGMAFVPFGGGQFANGDEGMGWFFFGTQGAMALVNVSAWSYLALWDPHGVDRTIGEATMYTSLALFGGFAIWGLIDALVNRQPEIFLYEEMRRQSDFDTLDDVFTPGIFPGLMMQF